jgi:hypothetical protein
MEVLGVLRHGGITVSTNATREKKPTQIIRSMRSTEEISICLTWFLFAWKTKGGDRQTSCTMACTHLSSFFPFSSRGWGAVLRSSIRMWMFSAYTMWQAPPPQWSKDDHATVEYTHLPIPWKEQGFKMALVLLPWWHLLVCLLGCWSLVRHITPQHETRNNVSIHSFIPEGVLQLIR